ncbi:glycosyltransferase family 2 protein [Methylotuvimicrobium sp. KM1]|uniref:glycosyltransferase family 2 protein n=1 Tax=Methylotuvimicrobium sp. KM1 TaxID=3377707 RepID=UPI00384E7215
MNPQLLIVILNYLATNVTIDCLRSLSICETVLNGRARVVVWENGSGKEAANTLNTAIEEGQWGQWVELYVSELNLGFTGGNNRVILKALKSNCPPDYFLLLNSDTLVTDDSLSKLIDFMDKTPDAGIAGSNLLTEKGEHQCSPFQFPGILSEFEQGLKLGVVSRILSKCKVSVPPPAFETKVDWVSGASMIVRKQVFEEIGLLDEGFFTYFEDVDICKRAQKAGWQVWYVPQSKVIHLEGASSGIGHKIVKRRPKFWFEARRRYYLKNEGKLRAACIDAAFILGFMLWRTRRFIQRKPDLDPPYMLFDFIRNCVFKVGFSVPWVELPSNQIKKSG